MGRGETVRVFGRLPRKQTGGFRHFRGRWLAPIKGGVGWFPARPLPLGHVAEADGVGSYQAARTVARKRPTSLRRCSDCRDNSEAAPNTWVAAAGVTDRLWEISDIVALVEATDAKPGQRGPYLKR